MDDFDYSVQISERDWDVFFQECQECDLLPPALAGLEDSGTSDVDDRSSSLSHVAEDRDFPKEDYPIDEPPDQTGLPVERYLSARRIPGPEDVLSCSEEDTHLESINIFFERLKSIEGGGCFLAEAKPKETWQEVRALEERAKEPAKLAPLSRAEAQSDSLAVSFSLAAKQDKVGRTISIGRGDKDMDRVGKPVETESVEDEAFGPAGPTVELLMREDDRTDEQWMQEKEDDRSKEKLQKGISLLSTSSKDKGGLRRKYTKDELQPSRHKDMGNIEHRAREGEMTGIRQPFQKEAMSLYDHQVELQTYPKALLCMGRAAEADNQAVRSANEQKEHWFFSMEVRQHSFRGHDLPSVKKKRKQVWSSEDPLVAGQGLEGLGGRTKSEKQVDGHIESKKQVERFEQEGAGQGEVVLGHDSKASDHEAGGQCKSFSAHQMIISFGPVPRSSEPLSNLCSVKETGIGSRIAEHHNDCKESITRLDGYSRENIPNFPDQQQRILRHDYQNSSQQICIPASNTEIHHLAACGQPDNSPERLKSGAVMIQHDPISPEYSGVSVPETRNVSEQFHAKEPDRFNIPLEGFQDQKLQPTSQMNLPEEDDKPVCQFSNVFPDISCSTESSQSNQSFVDHMSGVSRKQNIPEHEHKETQGQYFPTLLEEKEFIQKANTAIPSEPAEPSLSFKNICVHGPSWCNALDPLDVQCQKSEEVESHPEYQEVEEVNDVAVNNSNYETTDQCVAKTDNGNISPQISCYASENDEPSTVTSEKAPLFQEPKLADEQIMVQSGFIPIPPRDAVIGLGTNLTDSSVASDGNGISVKSTGRLDDSGSGKGRQTDEWLLENGENSPQTSTVECSKNSQWASVNAPAVNKVGAVDEPELQNNSSVDTPVLHISEDKDDSTAKCELSLHMESTTGATPPETNKPLKPLETKHPVHTMSAFWKEMEKLTINDILYLRSVSSTPRRMPQDSAMTETSDAGNSGYSSHLEDSKLDCMDVSTIPDFQEQCPLSLGACAKSSLEPKEKQGQRSLWSPSSRGVLWESELYPAGPGPDSDPNELNPGDSISAHFFPDKAQQGFRRMRKNISMQNLQAMEAKPHVTQVTSASGATSATGEKMLRESSSTIQKPEENGSSVPQKISERCHVKTSVASSLPGDEATEDYGPSFRKIFEYFFGAREARVSQVDTAHIEVPTGDGGSVPEMYDYFFSEFETGNFFFPFIQGRGNFQNDADPMTSCSGSSTRNLQFPEAYDYFFPDSSSSDSEDKEDSDDDQAPIRVVTRFDKGASEPPSTAATPDMYEHFFTSSDWRESLFWRNPLSLRRMHFTGLFGSGEGPTSCVVVTADQQTRSVCSTLYTDSAMGFHGAVSPLTPLYCLEERILRALAEQQRRCDDLQTAIAAPRDSPVLPLRQSDMCLICIAFASWVLKTANPQDADTWKAALLANISALSAIRFLRRCAREAGNE